MYPELEAHLLQCRNLPSPPAVALRIIELAQDPMADLGLTARVIGTDPARYRPLMIPSMIEKFGYVVLLAILYSQSRISTADAQAAIPDLILGTLFTIAFVKTRASSTE